MDNKFKKEFLKGSAAATVGTISAMLFHFISIMMLTRNLNQHDFGIYVLLLVISNLFVVISGFGLNITLVKFISGSDEKENNSSFRAVMMIRTAYLLIIAVLFFSFAGLILPFFNIADTEFVFYITILFSLGNFRDLFFNLLQGLRLYRKYAVIQVISAALRVLLIFLLLQMGILNMMNLILVELSTSIITIAILLFTVPLKRMLSVSPSGSKYRSLLKYSFPLYLNNLITFSYDRVSIFIISAFLNPVSVAFFDVSSKIPEALQRMFFSFTIVFFPSQSRLFGEGNKSGAAALMNKSLNFFSIITIFGILISFLFREEIIVLLFSSAYIESSLPFALLMLNLYLRILSNIMGYSLVASGNSSAPVKVNSITSAVNIALSMVFIPTYGFIGAVYSLLVMNVLSQVIYHFYIVKSQISQDGINYLRPLVILIVLLIPYYLFMDMIIVKLSIIAAYFIISWFYVDEFRNLAAGIAGYISKKRKFSVT